jgi:hypothetical protein
LDIHAQVYGNCTAEFVAGNTIAGKTFMGLASLLLGVYVR